MTKYLAGGGTLVTEMDYDDDGNLAWQRDPSGHETTYAYADGKLSLVYTPQGVWQYAYDPSTGSGQADRLSSVTDPVGTVRSREYDADGNVSLVKVDGDIVSTYTYTDGELTQRTDAAGQPYTLTYTDGQLTRQDDPTGAFTEYDYDPSTSSGQAGRLWKTRDGSGNEVVREYAVVNVSEPGGCTACSGSTASTPIERLVKVYYPTFTKEYVYDAEGRVSEEIYHLSDTESQSVTFEYDDFGRLVSATGPDNQTTSYGYDTLGRRTSVTDASGTTTFEYDRWDNLTALIDAESQRTEFDDYPDGKMWKERRPMGEETEYVYDSKGRLWRITDAKNQTTQYGYDTHSRLNTITYADGATVTLSYDDDGNLSGYSDDTTSATYTYDGTGRKLSETVDYGAFSKTFAYTYYGNGLKHTFTAPDSTIYTYTYGTKNELRTVQIPNVGNIAISAYAWNRPATITYPGGVQRIATYDALMRPDLLTVTAPDSTPLLTYDYGYNTAGNIVTKNTEHGNYTYAYDATSHLTSADNPVLDDESYAYDNAGNRTSASNANGAISHNLNNEFLTYGDIEYEYDANGNMVRKAVGMAAVNYIYNAANRLIRVEDEVTGTVIAEYYYDPFGRRLWKDVNGTRTYFFYSEEGLISEYDDTGVEIQSYGYKPDSTWTTDPLWLKQGEVYYWYQNDHLGTPQKLVDGDGNVVWSVQYTAFGESSIAIEMVENNLRFPGQYADAETGLHYNWNRYFNPEIGRYLQADPIGINGGELNLYNYAKIDPLSLLDNLGLYGYPFGYDPLNGELVVVGNLPEGYPQKVKEKLIEIAPLMKQNIEAIMPRLPQWIQANFQECSKLYQVVALKFIADEYEERKGVKGFLADWVFQDLPASTGMLMVPGTQRGPWIDFANTHKSWKDSNVIYEFIIRQLHVGFNDLGPANIELNTALQAINEDFEAASTTLINGLSKFLTTDEGTAIFSMYFAANAVLEFNGYCSCKYDRGSVELMVNRIREGEKYWQRVAEERIGDDALTPEQFEQWRRNPASFPGIPLIDPGNLDDAKYTFIENLIGISIE